ncbi:hypothetical protein [Vibrio sp. TBV020]|uniref:hypothetical protein n=1 Tax=Vibrio sp. TBV020 TaxID=3137398 RepID=UPI0038CDAD2A
MGFSPMGGASSYGQSKRDFDNSIGRDRHRDRNDHDRKKRESSYSTRQREERERQEQIKRAKAAKEKAEREAREKAERKARAEQKKAEAEAEKKAEAENERSGFSPMGGMSTYGLNASSISPVGGRGVLAGMRSASNPEENEAYERSQNPTEYSSIHFREPTESEAKAGIYNKENAYSGEAINENTSDENIARLTGDAIEEKQMEIARDFVSSPLGPTGKIASEAIGWVSSLFDSDTDYEQNLKEQAKSAMSGGDIIQNIGGAAQAGALLGSMNDVGVIKDIAPAVLNPVAGAVIGVADDIVGLNNYINNNKKYLEENNLLSDSQSHNFNRDRNRDRNKGVLAGMLPEPTPAAELVNQGPMLPDFTWVDGDEFNSNYGMGFKR